MKVHPVHQRAKIPCTGEAVTSQKPETEGARSQKPEAKSQKPKAKKNAKTMQKNSPPINFQYPLRVLFTDAWLSENLSAPWCHHGVMLLISCSFFSNLSITMIVCIMSGVLIITVTYCNQLQCH